MKNGCKCQVFVALYFDFAERCAVQQKLCSFAMQRDVAVDYSAIIPPCVPLWRGFACFFGCVDFFRLMSSCHVSKWHKNGCVVMNKGDVGVKFLENNYICTYNTQ